eukprot:11222860-Lingulodinium_polyedra.AAC.1
MVTNSTERRAAPLPFFNFCSAAKAVVPSKPKKPVKAARPWDFFNACVARPVSKAEIVLSSRPQKAVKAEWDKLWEKK